MIKVWGFVGIVVVLTLFYMFVIGQDDKEDD